VDLTTQTFYPQSSNLEFTMPRLIGKQSNPAIPLSLFLLAAIAVLTALEYVGVINVVDGFGNDARNERLRQRLENRTYPEQLWQR
jgi:hypothetical protein